MAKKIKDEVEKIVDEANLIRTWMDQSTEDHALILETLSTMIKSIQKIQLTVDVLREEVFIQRELCKKAPEKVINFEKVIKKVSPGFGIKDTGAAPKVVEYTKKNGEIGLKIKDDAIIYKEKAYKYLQECKYGCGNYISFDNYKQGQKALHITKELVPIGRYCPKYGDGE